MTGYSRITFGERVKLWTYLSEGFSQAEIARKIGRSKSTVCREFGRFPFIYNPDRAQKWAAALAKRPRVRRLDANRKLHREVFAGLKKRWSPDQISKILRRDFPNDADMRISPETIYTYIYVLPRGALRKELVSYLRQEKKSRKRRAGVRDRRGVIPEMTSIEERPAKVAHRSLVGDWEGDLIMGKQRKTAVGTLVERKTRTLLLVPLTKTDCKSVRIAFEKKLKTLPSQMRRSLTYDQGREMIEHRLFTKNTRMKVYFCHPSSPWERGTCENTNGLIRQYFPKGTDFSAVPRRELNRVQHELNERPRRTLDYRTPKEVFNAEILKIVPLTA